jgi:8-oxo-dGTP diphosphatase
MDLPPRKVADVDWPRWVPEQRASLLFVVKGGRILLIRKKRGLGAGKIKGPGGRIEPGESAQACAIRELGEELGIVPGCPSRRGDLSFQFTQGFSIHAEVFTAPSFTGEPRETAEAIPLWFPVGELPYAQMWEDDAIWFPLLLAGKCFSGRFVFDDDSMLDWEVCEQR